MASNMERNSKSLLEKFLLDDNENPYVANILVSIYNDKHEFSRISIKNAIESAKNGDSKSVTDLLENINTAGVWSGGSSRGFYHVGVYEALKDIKTKINVGVSIGAFPAVFRCLRAQGIETRYGKDLSPEKMSMFAYELRDASGLNVYQTGNSFSEKIKGKIKAFQGFYRMIRKSAFIDAAGLERFLNEQFKDLRIKDVDGLYIIGTEYNDGNKVTMCRNSDDEVFSEISLAKALRITTAVPYLFEPFQMNGKFYADGGLKDVMPVRTAFEKGNAEFVFGTCLVRKISSENPAFNGLKGKIEQHSRDIDILQINSLEPWTLHYTGEKSIYIIENGDPRGRYLLNAPDLSGVNWLDFFECGPSLVKRGFKDTLNLIGKFLSPKYKHPKYNPEFFIKQMK